MMPLFLAGAAVFGVFGALEGVRAVSLFRDRNPQASSAAGAAALLLSLGLIFIVMARIDG